MAYPQRRNSQSNTKKLNRKVALLPYRPGTTGQQDAGDAQLPVLTLRGVGMPVPDRDDTGPEIDTDAVPPAVAVPTVAPDQGQVREAEVGRLEAFLLRQQAMGRSPDMTAALTRIQRVITAHHAGGAADLDVRRALATMQLIEITGSPTVPLEDALRPRPVLSLTEPTFGLVLDGQRITSFNLSQMTLLLRARGQNPIATPDSLGYVMADGTFDGTTDELVALLDAIDLRLNPNVQGSTLAQHMSMDDNPLATRLALMAEQDRAEQDLIAELFRAAGLKTTMKGISAPQCRALRTWLEQHPQYLTNLANLDRFTNDQRQRLKAFLFGARGKGGAGDFKAGKREVHLAIAPDKPADQYVRLLLHETGHAAFQRVLIGDRKVGTELQAHVEALQRYAVLLDTLVGQPDDPQAWRKAAPHSRAADDIMLEITALERFIAADAAGWRTLSADAQRFYKAWLTLNQNKGRFLIGVDQGREGDRKDLHAANRQENQATTFIELCAEGFMNLAMGDLDPFVEVIQHRDDVPRAVKEAWTDVQDVLHRLGDPILGPPPVT
jgi:hypothetical protein